VQNRRHERVRELLIHAVGEVIRKELSIEETGLVNVNDVVLSGDMHSAVVFVSILGDEAQHKKGMAALRKKRKHLQSLVAQTVVLKYSPALRFEFDQSVERGNRVLQLIEELEKNSPGE
jgi:ribosome-binding factor A